MKTEIVLLKNLSKTALSYAVAKCQNAETTPDLLPNYATSWMLGGPILDEMFKRGLVAKPSTVGLNFTQVSLDGFDNSFVAESVILAGLQCYVFGIMGDEIDVPLVYLT